MNEQIEKLAVQAFSFASAADDSDESDANWWNAYNEKFAELIVQECAEVAAKVGEGYVKMGYVVPLECSNKIKEHFGVE